MSLHKNSFRKHERIKKQQDFQRISQLGEKICTKHFIIFIILNPSIKKIGITVSKKVGKAVKRNKVKRYIREFYRTHKELIVNGEISVIALKGASFLDYHSVCEELSILFKKE